MNDQIQVQVRAFASLRQALGTAQLTLSVPPDTTVAGLLNVVVAMDAFGIALAASRGGRS